jgi:hypothetical protein
VAGGIRGEIFPAERQRSDELRHLRGRKGRGHDGILIPSAVRRSLPAVLCDKPAPKEKVMDDIERNDDGADDDDEQFEQMIIENSILLHSLAALLVRKGILKQEELDDEMDKLYEEMEKFEEE